MYCSGKEEKVPHQTRDLEVVEFERVTLISHRLTKRSRWGSEKKREKSVRGKNRCRGTSPAAAKTGSILRRRKEEREGGNQGLDSRGKNGGKTSRIRGLKE